MARYLFCLFWLPVYIATAHEFPGCDSAQVQSGTPVYTDGFYHQTPEILSRLKLYRDEIKLINLELEGMHELLLMDKSNLSHKENIKMMDRRLQSLAHKMSDQEEQLRVMHRQLEKQTSAIRYCNADKVIQENYIRQIESYFNIPAYKRLYVDHNDYERYFFKLNVGYEYNSISGILKESSPRIGLLIYSHFDRMPYQGEYGFGDYGYQLFANVILSGNTGKQTTASTTVPEDEQIENTLGINVSVYKPVLRSKIRADSSHLFGPMIDIGTKQNDETTDIQSQYYLGVRSAMSPEHFIDVLFGRSPGQASSRMEIRGQMPVAIMGGGSRFFVGMLANMGVANKQENESDVFTVYVSWNIDFLDLFATGG